MKYCLKPYSGAADFRNRVAAIKNPDMMKNKRTPMTCMCGTYGGLAAAPTPKNARACPQQTICAARARQASSVIDVSFLVLANVNIPAPDWRNLVLQPDRVNPEATQIPDKTSSSGKTPRARASSLSSPFGYEC